MKLAIFGATGKIGRQVVSQALASGHEVTAHVRRSGKLDQDHPALRIVEGDVCDQDSVLAAIRGQDAVLCTLGKPLMNREGLRATGTRAIVEAMAAAKVGRIVCLSGLGAGDSRDLLPFHYRYIVFPLLMRHVYADHEAQEACLRSTKLDWTIVRPGNFAKGRHTGSYWHGQTRPDRRLKLKISHQDVADFMLKQLDDSTYLHQSPSLSY